MKQQSSQKNTSQTKERPPIVVVMGHIDHGKSKLLDYIRKTNVVDKESGGITQHLSAYEVTHKNESGDEKRITFLDTPGHEAFQKMRYRGAEVADIAILIIASDEGVKAQTKEAYAQIKKCGLPVVIAINKIDKAGSNVDKTKNDLLEHEIYLEGLGGDIPSVAISAKEGTNVDELLDMILLVAELGEFKGEEKKSAEGLVIEVHRDTQKGIAATLIIKDGTLESGMFVVVGESIAPARIIEDFTGKAIKEATFSSPVQVIGFNTLPEIGEHFSTHTSKKEAESKIEENKKMKKGGASQQIEIDDSDEEKVVLPIILKADVQGSLDAIEHELEKIPQEDVQIKIVQRGVGAISENDVKMASGNTGTAILGFHTTVDASARDVALRLDIAVELFDIIYKLSEWVEKETKKRAPEKEIREVTGKIKVLKTFSKTKKQQVLGGTVTEGIIAVGDKVKIIRREDEVGDGIVVNLQQQKADAKKVTEGNEFGAQIDAQTEIERGDVLESVIISSN